MVDIFPSVKPTTTFPTPESRRHTAFAPKRHVRSWLRAVGCPF
ncbi:MAG: hypothetical protein QW587_11430 [Candidatus Bathyarchaeia archaeon]